MVDYSETNPCPKCLGDGQVVYDASYYASSGGCGGIDQCNVCDGYGYVVCGKSYEYGPRHDRYASTCDLPMHHHEPYHEGQSAVIPEWRIRWVGGGRIAGDRLPGRILMHGPLDEFEGGGAISEVDGTRSDA